MQCRQSSSESAMQLSSGIGLKAAVAHFQREMIVAALQASDANWSDAARKLALDPSNLHKLAIKLGIKQSAKHSEKQTQ